MNKIKFVLFLSGKLNGLPPEEWEDRISFYIEAIDDRMEEGLSEEEAVAALGSIDNIVAEILADIPLTRLVAKKIKPKRRLAAWEIVLLALGSPIWLALALSALAVFVSIYVSIWSVVISLWAVFGSLLGCTIGGIASGILFASLGNGLSGIAMISAGIVCAGLSIFLFFGCRETTKGIAHLTKKLALSLKKCFVKKEAAQ